jgi:hypothetical protein
MPQHEAAIEQVRHDTLREQGRLADAHVPDESGVSQPAWRTADAPAQLRVERQPEAVPDDRLVNGRMAGGQGERRSRPDRLADLEILEVRSSTSHV